MSGVNRSIAMGMFFGTRAGSGEVGANGVSTGHPVTYLPARIENGVRKKAKATFTVFHNSGFVPLNGKATGEKFKIWAYGGLAEQIAKWLSPGRAIDLITNRHEFVGNHYVNGQPMMDATGQPVLISRQSDVIQQFLWREEATKWTQHEAVNGLRPMNWDNPAHPDYELHKQNLRTKNAQVWDGQSATFGFAKVLLPQGIQIDQEYYQNLRNKMAQTYGVAAGMAGTVNAVGATFGTPATQAAPLENPGANFVPQTPGYVAPAMPRTPGGYPVNTAPNNSVPIAPMQGNGAPTGSLYTNAPITAVPPIAPTYAPGGVVNPATRAI